MTDTATHTKTIDGKAYAERLRMDLAEKVAMLKTVHGLVPGLSVILVGKDPASEIYVRNKATKAKEIGMNSRDIPLPESITQKELLDRIETLNKDPNVHGILVQLPLPKHIDKSAVISAIAPEKDVDGFHPENVRKLERGEKGFVPCTPLGCMLLLKDTMGQQGLKGKKAVVLGRSPIVGKPMKELLRHEGCSVETIHSQTTPEDRARWLKDSDIVVAAVGKPKLVSGKELKEGCVVIDVGITRVDVPGGKSKLTGDVDFESCQGIASAITPVPGGVGPMTIACLLKNTCDAAFEQHRVKSNPAGHFTTTPSSSYYRGK